MFFLVGFSLDHNYKLNDLKVKINMNLTLRQPLKQTSKLNHYMNYIRGITLN
jgi:hypothetical protein